MLPVTAWSFAAATELANTETDRADAPGRGPPRTACAAANLITTGVMNDLGGIHQMLGSQMPVIGLTRGRRLCDRDRLRDGG